MHDNAFFNPTFTLPATQKGILGDMTFAVKDVFSVRGHRNSAGNPAWLATHTESTKNAPAIDLLLAAGATLTGIAHTDELMYSLNGENIHYGTPLNPLAPSCIPGGSSSGSASAVANEITTFALGTDTGGSVRIPSSYCGLYGFRPTHNAISCTGVIPLAPSFDTVGWMAKSVQTLQKVGDVLLPPQTFSSIEFQQLLIEQEAFSFISQSERWLLEQAIPTNIAKTAVNVATDGLAHWATTFRLIQGIEAWQMHGEWIEKEQPLFAPAIAERFEWASKLSPSSYEAAKNQQAELANRLYTLLGEDKILVLPTAASVAPKKNAPLEAVEQIRSSTMQLTSIAGLAGLPQVTVPIFTENGMALGLSFIANKHLDRSLLAFVSSYFGGK